MSLPTLPSRPRLAAHVLARRHVIDGQEVVILHDQRRDEVLQIGRREWAMLEAADGTRELEGIVVAARRAGSHGRVAAVRELLVSLMARGMVEAGEEAELVGEQPLRPRTEVGRSEVVARVDSAAEATTGPGEAATKGAAPEEVATTQTVPGELRPRPDERATTPTVPGERQPRPLVPLPGEGMRCSGAGTCCHLYGTVMLFPEEARRVQTLLPQWRVGTVPPERWFSPVRGSEPGPVQAAIARDGACGFLQEDGLCAVHRVGGGEAKPWGCRSFPRTFVDDGVAVHVSAKAECPCMLDPRGGEPEPLVDPAWADAGDLPSAIVVRQLPDSIELKAGRWAAREEVRAWVSAVAARPAPVDVAATLWALGDRVGADGRLPELELAWDAAPPEPAAVGPWIEALYPRAAARAREHAAWRSERDLVRRISTALATLTLLLRDAEALAEALAVPPEHPAQEARYWQMGVHGYRWFGRAALAVRLRDEAVRVWVGRSLSAVLPGGADDPHVRAPLALVEAMLRAHGIGGYVDEVDRSS